MEIQQSAANFLQFGRSVLSDRGVTAPAILGSGGGTPAAVSAPTPAPAPAPAPSLVKAAARPAGTAEVDTVHLAEVVASINKTMATFAPGLEFFIDKDTNSTVVRVIDHQTKEVIRQMPSQEALEIARALDQVQGLLIREKI